MLGLLRTHNYMTKVRVSPALSLLAASILMLAMPQPAQARYHHTRHSAAQSGTPNYILPGSWASRVSPTDPEKDAAEIMDGVSGRVLFARNATAERHPASLTKMMTLYMLFDSMKRGQNNLQSMIPVSAHAASMGRTKLYLRPGESISADNAIKAIVVISANDVAVAIGEFLGGTEDHFAEMMTERARQLGMTDTFYHNASGLPDERQISTAQDLAILARHLAYDYPQYFRYFSTAAFIYRGRYYTTHDNLIGHYDGADGIKTGYTQASGFNLVSSITRSGVHIIGVVMGGRTARLRDHEMMRLLDNTFAQINTNPRIVNRTNIPWQAVAANTVTAPVTAGFSIANNAQSASSDPNDEDAAESRDEPGDALGNLIANTAPPMGPSAQTPRTAGPPQPTPSLNLASVAPPAPVPAHQDLLPPKIQPTLSPRVVMTAALAPRVAPPNIRPTPSPRTMVASLGPRLPPPNIRPSPRAAEIGEGDIGNDGRPLALRSPLATLIKSASVPVNTTGNWAIQIGAFGDAPSANAQLNTYADKSKDVLAGAQHVVVPFQSVDGKTLYRARFGPFMEAEARAACQRMTERGQTCFASIAR